MLSIFENITRQICKKIFKLPTPLPRSSMYTEAIAISQIRRLPWNRSRGNTQPCAGIQPPGLECLVLERAFVGAFRIENLSEIPLRTPGASSFIVSIRSSRPPRRAECGPRFPDTTAGRQLQTTFEIACRRKTFPRRCIKPRTGIVRGHLSRTIPILVAIQPLGGCVIRRPRGSGNGEWKGSDYCEYCSLRDEAGPRSDIV